MNKILITIFLVALFSQIVESASVSYFSNPYFVKDPQGKVKISIEYDGEEEGEENKCDGKCVAECAKKYPTDPDAFVQCFKDCGCTPPINIANPFADDDSENKCDHDCFIYCATQFQKNPDAMVKCFKDCGCIPPPSKNVNFGDLTEKFDNENDNSKMQEIFKFSKSDKKMHCCPFCIYRCWEHCPGESTVSKCKKVCQKKCCHNSEEEFE